MTNDNSPPGAPRPDPRAPAHGPSPSAEAQDGPKTTAVLDRFEKALLAVDRITTRDLLGQASAASTPVQAIEALILPALERIGRGWDQGTTALSQVYMAGRICEGLVDSVLPAGAAGRRVRQRVAMVVLEDFHMLGKRIVYSVLRANGFDLLDYGRLDVDGLVHRVEQDGTEVLLISTLMLPSALRVAEVKKRLGSTKVAVGGAPFRLDERLWREVGADAMGRSATDAVQIVEGLTEGRP